MITRNRLAALAIAAIASVGSAAAPAVAAMPEDAGKPHLFGSGYSLQNNLNFAGELTPFFDSYSGVVTPKVEIGDGYIYDIDFDKNVITMAWNTDPEWDIFEPYVGGLAGLTQEEASALPLADEYWITFDHSIAHLTFAADPSMPLVPNVRLEDDFTLVVSVPGGTTIGDGYDAVITVRR